MNKKFVTKNCGLSEKLEAIIEKKLAKLDKYFEDDAECLIYLKRENKVCKIEISLEYRGTTLRAEAKAAEFYDAIDIVVPKIERQIAKHRSKLEAKLRSGWTAGLEEIETEEPSKLVKTKVFELEPVDVESAITELELRDYPFYVFCDKADGCVKVLYLRDDGNVGLINPIIVKR